MVGTTDDEIMETIDLLAHYGIMVEQQRKTCLLIMMHLAAMDTVAVMTAVWMIPRLLRNWTSLSVWYQADSRIKEAVMEQTGTNQCLVFVGMETHVADRMEDYARQNDMNVVDTVFKDDKAIDKLTYYIEREGVICILVRSIWDISTDRETVKSIMKLAAETMSALMKRTEALNPATLVWDGGAGC